MRLVITDLMMPIMNGLGLIRRLRELAPELPIIATSGLTDTDMRSELDSLNVTELLMKPSGVSDLLVAVQRILGPSPESLKGGDRPGCTPARRA